MHERTTDTARPDLVRRIDAYWRAANYLSVGQIYLYDNPLLKKPLDAGAHQAAPAGSLGHDAGAELHLRALESRHQGARPRMSIYITGPGHGGPGLVANAYLEGTYSEVYPHVSQDEEGMKRLFTQFSFPGGIPSHVAAETPGSIHEGGELGLLAVSRVRRGIRQSRSARGVRRRRWRSGDRPARHELALEQVPQPGPRRRRAADPAFERVQDCRPDRAGPHSPRRTGRALPRLRLHAVCRRGRRPSRDAPTHGGHTRYRCRRDSHDPAQRPRRKDSRSARAGP